MAININIPQPTQSLGQTWSPIQANFNAIQAAWVINHVDYNSLNPLAGKHNLVTMPEQAADPVTLADEMAIYTKDVNGISQLFIAPEAAGVVRNITGAYYTPALPWALGSKGYTTLPSGLFLQFGYNTITGTGPIAFPIAFPNACFIVQTTISIDTNIIMSVNTITAANFTINKSSLATISFYWFAIGY